MDGQRFDAMTRVLAGELPRRGVIKALTAATLVGAATRAAVRPADADGNLGDFCNDRHKCSDPLVCINTECDHCRKEGDCHTGWCCKGYTCTNHGCVACSSSKGRGVVSEGCKKKKKKRKKKH